MAMLIKSVARMKAVARSRSMLPVLVTGKRGIKIGDPLPSVVLYEGSPDNKILASELYKGKSGILFAVLAAFSPGCTHYHIPDFLEYYDKFRAEGYMISCVCVNDPYVMAAWGKYTNADGKIRMLADTHGEFTRAVGMELECKKVLGTNRSQKYSLVVEDGLIQSINVDPDHTGLACLLCIRTLKNLGDHANDTDR